MLSLVGQFRPERFGQRPYRAPHHTASAVALVGGGNPPRPGEISLAHQGVMFLDELPEFDRKVLETLREPLESGRIHIARAARQAEFPAEFQLVAAMNPCPCGFSGHRNGKCRCTPDQIARYRGKLSGPFLDRIDLLIEVPALPVEALDGKADGESSAAVRERVEAALARQQRTPAANRIPASTRAKSIPCAPPTRPAPACSNRPASASTSRRAPGTASSRSPAPSPTLAAARRFARRTSPRRSSTGGCPVAEAQRSTRTFAFLLAGMAALGPFSIDTYLPSFHEIAEDLGATPLQVQQTLSAYLLAFATDDAVAWRAVRPLRPAARDPRRPRPVRRRLGRLRLRHLDRATLGMAGAAGRHCRRRHGHQPRHRARSVRRPAGPAADFADHDDVRAGAGDRAADRRLAADLVRLAFGFCLSGGVDRAALDRLLETPARDAAAGKTPVAPSRLPRQGLLERA